jgi:hypothetical protein
MVFYYKGKEYVGETAIEIVREMALDADWHPRHGYLIRDYLRSELAGLSDRIHLRDLELARHHSEELLAFNYLCLLDEYGVGHLRAMTQSRDLKSGANR